MLKINNDEEKPPPDSDSVSCSESANIDDTKKYWGVMSAMRSMKMNSFVSFLFGLLGFS